MFFGNEYNIPPCCDQKYFTHLFRDYTSACLPFTKEQLVHGLTSDEADEVIQLWNMSEKTTSLFMQHDYTLQNVLSKVLLHIPMSDISLLTPAINQDLINGLCTALSKHWFNGKDNDSYMLKHLVLIASEDAFRQYAKSIGEDENNGTRIVHKEFSKFGERVSIAIAETSHIMFVVKNTEHEYAFSGTANLVASTSKQNFTSLMATCDRTNVKEISTVLRILSHKKI